MATGNSFAYFREDAARPGGGAVPSPGGGWDWYLRVSVEELQTHRRAVLDAVAHSDSGDSLVQIRDKQIAAVKAACADAAYDYAVTAVMFPGATILTNV